MPQSARLQVGPWLAFIAVFSLKGLAAEPVPQKFTMPIGDVFEKGMGPGAVRLADDAKGVILYDRVLYEDDGPGLGSDAQWLAKEDRSPSEELKREVRLKKILVIDRPEALEGRFCIRDGALLTINGQSLPDPTHGDYPYCPTNLLKKGENEIIMAAPRNKTVWVQVAPRKHILENAPQRADRPARSFKSVDGGKTWQPIDGEIFVRIQLVQFVPQGELVSPVIDLAQRAQDASILQPAIDVKSATLKTESDTPAGTGLQFFVRTGSSPAYEADRWDAWQPAASVKVPARHRYLQWKAELTTTDGTKTPLLKNVTVEATIAQEAPPAWAAGLKITAIDNADFRYSAMSFAYEDPNSPQMKHLRAKYKLDEIVAPGKTELEKLVLLRNWVSKAWKYKPPEDHYPAWDADEILTLKYGFCVQYAIVYMQCATSLGYQTRFFMGNNYGTGHEVTEVWSNDYKKWVYMDPNNNMFHMNPKTHTPMSALEIRDLILKTYYQDSTASRDTMPKDLRTSDDIATCYGTQTEPVKPREDPKIDWGGKDGKYYVPPNRWMILRYLPRNNFLSQPTPVPRTEGAGDWHYPDFWMWNDGRNLTQYRYRNYTARRSDLNWTINEVRFDAAYSVKPGTLAVQLCTVTPYFETFLVNLDGKGWKPSGRTLDWTLQAGKNRLEMRARNTSGIEGPPSFIEISR